MPFELFLALRYLYSRRRRQMARFTALAALVGIAFGVASLIVALSLSNGFRDEMRDKILRGTAHITLMRRDGQALRDWRALVERIRTTSGVSDAQPTTYEGSLLRGANGSAYAVLRGVDSGSSRTVSEIRSTLIAGTIDPVLNDSFSSAAVKTKEEEERPAQAAVSKTDSSERVGPKIGRHRTEKTSSKDEADEETANNVPQANVVIGAELAARTGLSTGDTGEIILPEETAFGLAPAFYRVRVAGVFRSGLYEYDSTWVYLSLASVSSFKGSPETSATVISIDAIDIYNSARVAAEVRARLGDDYVTVDWQEANRPLFAALALERRMGLFIIALIILVATLNITTTLVLVVIERRSDIAILTAMGARARSIMLIFMIEGALVGIIGAVCGIIIGLIACAVGQHYKLVSLPADVYSIGNVPFHAQARDVLLSALVAFLLSLLATIYPARVAARTRPAEALRDA